MEFYIGARCSEHDQIGSRTTHKSLLKLMVSPLFFNLVISSLLQFIIHMDHFISSITPERKEFAIQWPFNSLTRKKFKIASKHSSRNFLAKCEVQQLSQCRSFGGDKGKIINFVVGYFDSILIASANL